MLCLFGFCRSEMAGCWTFLFSRTVHLSDLMFNRNVRLLDLYVQQKRTIHYPHLLTMILIHVFSCLVRASSWACSLSDAAESGLVSSPFLCSQRSHEISQSLFIRVVTHLFPVLRRCILACFPVDGVNQIGGELPAFTPVFKNSTGLAVVV
jgi:hypothetical protein